MRAMGHSASVDNDLRENPEFLQLRTKVTYQIPNKIAEIEAILRSFVLIEETPSFKSGKFEDIEPGADVVLVADNGTQRVVSILGYGDGDPARGAVSYLSPVGQALLHHEVGDEIELPYQGKQVVYEIFSIGRSAFLE